MFTEAITQGTDEKLSVQEALERHGADWPVEKYQAGFLKDGKWITVPNRMFTVRDDINMAFEAVGKDYTVIDNLTGMQFLTDLADEDGIVIERVLQFGLGREIAIVSRLPEHVQIGDDDAIRRMVWTTRHDGRGSGQGFGTNQIIVCKNTLEIAKGNAKFKYTIRHNKNAEMRLQDAREAIKLSFKKTEAWQKVADRLLTESVNAKLYNDFLNHVSQIETIDKDKNPRAFDNADKLRYTLHDISRNREYMENYRNTKWGLMQTATDYTSNVQNFRNDNTKFQKLIEGAEINNRAYEFLTA